MRTEIQQHTMRHIQTWKDFHHEGSGVVVVVGGGFLGTHSPYVGVECEGLSHLSVKGQA